MTNIRTPPVGWVARSAPHPLSKAKQQSAFLKKSAQKTFPNPQIFHPHDLATPPPCERPTPAPPTSCPRMRASTPFPPQPDRASGQPKPPSFPETPRPISVAANSFREEDLSADDADDRRLKPKTHLIPSRIDFDPSTSLRAQRSNPSFVPVARQMDCFASARNDVDESEPMLLGITPIFVNLRNLRLTLLLPQNTGNNPPSPPSTKAAQTSHA